MSLFLLCQNFQIAIVIKKQSVVQTGAKIQSGGLNEGLMIKEYQGSLKPTVAKPPIVDAEKVTSANNKKDKNLFFNIFLLYNRIWKKKKLFG